MKVADEKVWFTLQQPHVSYVMWGQMTDMIWSQHHVARWKDYKKGTVLGRTSQATGRNTSTDMGEDYKKGPQPPGSDAAKRRNKLTIEANGGICCLHQLSNDIETILHDYIK